MDKYNSLTKSAKKVADYVLEHKIETQFMSITSLAEECGVADATITRFCHSLGLAGYNDFKLALAKAITTSERYNSHHDELTNTSNDSRDKFKHMCSSLYENHMVSIRETMDGINEESIRKAVTLIRRAPRVYCFGQGGSMILAMEAWARFVTVLPNFICVEDSHMQAMTAALAEPNDVIFYVSYSGTTKDLLDVLQRARARGISTILITHFQKSPAVALADVILLCGSKESPLQGGAVSSKMSILYIIDVLYNMFCQQYPELCRDHNELAADAIASKSV
jgi:DNA-binding MurR/RpiR family transcriptional regulator